MFDFFIFHFRLHGIQCAHETEAVENPVYEDQEKFWKIEISGSGPAPPPLPPPRNEKAASKHPGDRESYIEMRPCPAQVSENVYENPSVIPNPNVSGKIYQNATSDTYKNLPAHYAVPTPAAAKEETIYENAGQKI